MCRTFGDIEAKLPQLGGTRGVVICDPEIGYHKNGSNTLDYIMIASDGIYDKISNEDINKSVWQLAERH